MPFSTACRRPDNGRVVLPALLPERERLIALYGELMRPGEALGLSEFAQRVKQAHGCKEQGSDFTLSQANKDAFAMTAWAEMMVFVEDHISHFGMFPLEFYIEYEDVEYGFDADDCLRFMGPAGADYFHKKIEEKESEVAL